MGSESSGDEDGLISLQMLEFFERLDRASRSIIASLTCLRYADIDELAHNIGMPHHEILRRINGVILPHSREILGKEIISFENARIDSATGKNVLFSWWIDKSVPLYISDAEVFENPERVLLVAEVPGLEISEPFRSRVHYRNGVLQIELSRDDEANE